MSERCKGFAAGFAIAAALWFLDVQGRESAHRLRLALAEAGGRLKGAAQFSRELDARGYRPEQQRRRR